MKMIQSFKNLMPKLSNDLHKGQSGRIAIVGGSKEYSGAPYFSSISSLRVGADLAYVLTTEEAAPVIKSYSPELIVLPLLDSQNAELEMQTWMPKFHTLIIGPGLGRSSLAFKSFRNSFEYARKQDIPVVIDADGLYAVNSEPGIISGYRKCILTPNFIEFKRLYQSSFNVEYDESLELNSSIQAQCKAVSMLACRLNNVTIMKKGSIDIISDGIETSTCDATGSLKRCGGIGDLLTGTIGTFVHWTNSNLNANANINDDQMIQNPNILAAFNASMLVREASRRAFLKYNRSILAVDIIEQLPSALYDLFDKE